LRYSQWKSKLVKFGQSQLFHAFTMLLD